MGQKLFTLVLTIANSFLFQTTNLVPCMFLFKAEVFVRFIVLKFVEHFLDQTPKELNMMSILKQREKNIQTPVTLWSLIT